jgi:glycosyltransferase involved in cell wall biosynthesis
MTRRDYRDISQWLVPEGRLGNRNGLPSMSVVRDIVGVCDAFAPDLIHVWGTEGYWGLLTTRQLLRHPTLLEMQGLKLAIANVFYGELSLHDRLHCIGMKEVLKRRAMYHDRRDFERWGIREREIIQGHRFIDVQSSWMAAQIQVINPNARLFKADRTLRTEFERAVSWQSTGHPVIFTTSAYPLPFKGLHIAIRAAAELRQRCPGVRLRIAGPHQRVGIRQEGYVRWLNSLARKVGMEGHVEWLGILSAAQTVQELQMASAALIPTFVESYCVAMAEAMQVGTPTVAAFTGGTAHLGRDEETCLFFPPGDSAMCTFQLERVLKDRELAVRLSNQARKAAVVRHDRKTLVQQQIETYRQVLAEAAGDGVIGCN